MRSHAFDLLISIVLLAIIAVVGVIFIVHICWRTARSCLAGQHLNWARSSVSSGRRPQLGKVGDVVTPLLADRSKRSSGYMSSNHVH